VASGKKELLQVLHSALADVERFSSDAQRRDFDAVSLDYAMRVLAEIESNLRICIEKAEGI
jgi:hypothetical protein